MFKNRFPGAKFKGLYDIINNEPSPEAETTAEVLYSKIVEDFCMDAKGNERQVPVQFSQNLGIGKIDVDAEVTLRGLLNGLFNNAETMCELLRKLEVSIEIITCPNSPDEADYGAKGAPKMPEGDLNPMIIWGLDAYGPGSSAPAPAN